MYCGVYCVYSLRLWSDRVGSVLQTGWKWYEIARFHFCFWFCLEARTSLKLTFGTHNHCILSLWQFLKKISIFLPAVRDINFSSQNDVIFFINHFTDFFEMESCLDNHQCRFHHEKKDFKGKESLILDDLLLIGIRCIHVYDHMSKLNAFF